MTLREILRERGDEGSNSLDLTLKEVLAGMRNPRDQLNQYSFPFGLPELRHAIADYTHAFYGCRPDPEDQITVVLGASEGMAVALRTLLDPGAGVVVMQPYHELYPSQAAIFGLVPRFVTLREDRASGTWRIDRDEVRAAVSDASVKAFVVNTPHNPTGKVFGEDELRLHRGAVPGARSLRDHRRDLRTHHVRRTRACVSGGASRGWPNGPSW